MDYQTLYETTKDLLEDTEDVLKRIALRYVPDRQPGPMDQINAKLSLGDAYAYFEENGRLHVLYGWPDPNAEKPAPKKRGPKPKVYEPPHVRSLAMTLTDEADACA
jgi:hypothetical protein